MAPCMTWAVQWPPSSLWMDSLRGPVWLETGVCHPKMKARPINIIEEHLLLVTTRGELLRPPPSISCSSGPVRPSLTPRGGRRCRPCWPRTPVYLCQTGAAFDRSRRRTLRCTWEMPHGLRSLWHTAAHTLHDPQSAEERPVLTDSRRHAHTYTQTSMSLWQLEPLSSFCPPSKPNIQVQRRIQALLMHFKNLTIHN